MLSTPNYGLATAPLQCLKWETTIANAVIDNMQGIYVQSNLENDVVLMFHVDNTDWLEDTPDGKKCITLFTGDFYSTIACINRRRQIFTNEQLWKNY